MESSRDLAKEEKDEIQKRQEDINEILDAFYISIEESGKLEKVESIKYFDSIGLNNSTLTGVVTVKEKDKETNKTKIHGYIIGEKGRTVEIFEIDSKGHTKIKSDLLDGKVNKLELEKILAEKVDGKDSKETASIIKMTEEDEKELAKRGKSPNDKDDQKDSKENDENGEQKGTEEEQKLKEDLKESDVEVDVTKLRKITDSHVKDRDGFNEVFGKEGTANYIAFSRIHNRYVLVQEVDGKFVINDALEMSEMTTKKVQSISSDGNSIETKVPYMMARVKGNINSRIAFTIDPFGIPDIETVKITDKQHYISRQVRTEGEIYGDPKGEENINTRNEISKNGKKKEDDLAEKIDQINKDDQIDDKVITPDDYIPGTEIKWGELMEETGYTLIEAVERYNREIERPENKGKEHKDIVSMIIGDMQRYQGGERHG